MIKVAIVAVEQSGDTIGASLIKALRRKSNQIEVLGVSGPEMRSAGCTSLGNIDDLSVMGIVDVIRNYPRLKRLQRELINMFLERKINVFVGIDGPDFNLGIAQRLKAKRIRTIQFVCPQVWAWREARVKKIGASIDQMLALFPFEESFFLRKGLNTRYVGHPLADLLELLPRKKEARNNFKLRGDGIVLALMPGSREAEINHHLYTFLEAAQIIRDSSVRPVNIVVGSPSQKFEKKMGQFKNDFSYQVVVGDSRGTLTAADVAIVTSGTVTLESMLCGTPMVVAYKTAPINYFVLSRLINIQYISLPNILTNSNIVPELLQDEVNSANIVAEVNKWLSDKARRDAFYMRSRAVHQKLKRNSASLAADVIFEELDDDK